VERDEEGWCVTTVFDGQRRVLSRHASEELARRRPRKSTRAATGLLDVRTGDVTHYGVTGGAALESPSRSSRRSQ
jgi:hypothetical protein